MTTKRAAIYCRVSTTGQEEDGTSLDTQEERCRHYVSEQGYDTAGIYRNAYSGSKYRERPQLNELRRLVRTGSIDVVVAYSIDRLSRNQAHLYIVAEEIEDNDARLEFATTRVMTRERFTNTLLSARFIRCSIGMAFIQRMPYSQSRTSASAEAGGAGTGTLCSRRPWICIFTAPRTFRSMS